MEYKDLEGEQKEWVDKQASLPFEKWFEVFLELKRKMKSAATKEASDKYARSISLVAQKRLLNKGYTKLAKGSYWTWMEKTWFEQARDEGVIEYIPAHPGTDTAGNILPGIWVPAYEEKQEQVEVGKKGNRSIYETQTIRDYSRFLSFENRYLAWKSKNMRPAMLTDEQIQQAITF